MTTLDYVVFFAYLAGILGFGLLMTRLRETRIEFLVAGRRMAWAPVGLSVMVTVFSASNFIAFSGEVLTQGLYVLLVLPAFGLVTIPVVRWIIPFFAAHKAVSAYAVLEERFDRRVRRLASLLFVLWRAAWMGLALYSACLLLSRITAVDLRALVLLTGAIAVLYTIAGGMPSIMWTDVAQFAVLFGAVLVSVPVASRLGHGLDGVFRTAADHGLLRPFHPFDPVILSLDPRIRITLWSAILGSFVAFIARYGVDQRVVQRYFSARSAAQASRGFILNISCFLIVLLSLAFLGLAAHAHALATGTAVGPSDNPAQHLARFIAAFPAGVAGLFVSGLLAATMSSVDSGLHSCCTALATDFGLGRTGGAPGASDADLPQALVRERLTIVALGAAVVLLALQGGRLGSVFELTNRVINGFGSPLLALFVAGFFPRRFTARGVLVGGALGAVWSIAVSLGLDSLALHYYAVVNLLGAVALCWLCSLADRALSRRAD